jgi:hypothetical protein
MAPSLENQRVAFTITWVAISYEETRSGGCNEEEYVCHRRHVVCTKKRAVALAKAFINKVDNSWDKQREFYRQNPDCSYYAVQYYCRAERKLISLNLLDLLYVTIREDGKGKQEEIVIRA